MRLVATWVVASMMVVTGCSSDAPSYVTPSLATSPSFDTAPDGVPEALDDGSVGDIPEDNTPPTIDPTRAEAARTAVIVMTLFGRKNLDQDVWLAALTPHLTPQAVVDFSWVRPYKVPVTRVTGRATVVPTDSAWLARIHVPTDAGLYLVILSRTTANPQWLVERIVPPEPAVV